MEASTKPEHFQLKSCLSIIGDQFNFGDPQKSKEADFQIVKYWDQLISSSRSIWLYFQKIFSRGLLFRINCYKRTESNIEIFCCHGVTGAVSEGGGACGLCIKLLLISDAATERVKVLFLWNTVISIVGRDQNNSLAAPGAFAHRLQRLKHLTACLIQNGRRGLEIGQDLGYWTLQSTFVK